MKNNHRASLLAALAAVLLMLLANALLGEGDMQIRAAPLLARRDGMLLFAGEAAPEGKNVLCSREQLYAGLLLYVGEAAPLPAWAPAPQARDVRRLVGLYVPAAERVALSEETIYALCALSEENPLVTAWIMEGMRSPQAQTALQRAAFTGYQATLPVAEALARAMEDVPDSGKSEHQLATAFDVQLGGALDWSQADPMARSGDGKWLLENAWRYGFIRRYPPEKEGVTGVKNEAMHWRYVGAAHAAVMHTAGWCLEEYLQALHAYGTLRLQTAEGKSLWVVCRNMQPDGAVFSVPSGFAAAPSADNLGWAVCVLQPEGEKASAPAH